MTTLPGWSRSDVYKLENDLQRTAENRQICRGVGFAAEVGTVRVFLKPNRIQPTNFETEPNRTDLIF
jgi:hypothetical protein